jgi:hypothetical protein
LTATKKLPSNQAQRTNFLAAAFQITHFGFVAFRAEPNHSFEADGSAAAQLKR